MEDKDFIGHIVFLTVHFDKYLKIKNPLFDVPLSNRLAKVIKVFDWDTEEGKLLLSFRDKEKWKDKDPRDFKFVLKVYMPDLIIKGKTGIAVEEVLPRYYPGTKHTLFDIFPDKLLEDINKKDKEFFSVKKKEKIEDKK